MPKDDFCPQPPVDASAMPLAPAQPGKPVEMSSKEAYANSKQTVALLAVSAIEAILWTACFEMHSILMDGIPGIGITVYALVKLGLVCALLNRRARYDRVTVPLIVATVLAAIVPALLWSQTVRLLDLVFVWGLGTYTSFLLAGTWREHRAALEVVAASIATYFVSSFGALTGPAKAIGALFRKRGEGPSKFRDLLVGIVLACLLLVIIVPLLGSADDTFGNALSHMFDAVPLDDPTRLFVDIFTALIAFPLLFGQMKTLVTAQTKDRSKAQPDAVSVRVARGISPVTALVVLVVLALLYLVFLVAQAHTLAPAISELSTPESVSAPARQGFFQLVFVTIVNTALILLALQVARNKGERGERRVLKTLSLVLVSESAFLLAGAAFRMFLYVSAYGLTMLRLLTVFGMALVLVVLIALVVKCFVENANFFAVFMTAGIALWLVFCLCNPEGLVANYNVDRALSDPAFELDWSYLYGLSADADGALDRYWAAHPGAHVSEEENLVYPDLEEPSWASKTLGA